MTLVEWQMSRQPRSKWRRRARAAIEAVIRSFTPSGPHPSPAELLKLVDAAYPFGERKYEPYKCWLVERKLFRAAIDGSQAPTLPTKDEADACEVARDMVLEERLDEAKLLLEQAPNRLARRCPACGALPGKSCSEPRPEPGDPQSGMWSERHEILLVPHHARLVGHLDAGPLFLRP